MTQNENEEFSARLAAAASAVEARLIEIVAAEERAGTPARLAAAMRHALLAGGKRFRPFLVLEAARLHGGDAGAGRALDVAAALECVHAYSLVHDDLPAMDNDTLRRGQPTVWKAYDEWTAILAGDALLTLAFEVVAESEVLAPAVRSQLVAMLARAAGARGMVGGQMLDLEAEKLHLPASPDAAHVRRLQGMKTGALIAFASEAGALAGGGSEDQIAAQRLYGRAVGLAFQVSDDILDVTGDASVVGKAVGKDAALGKATLVAVEGLEAASRTLEQAVADAIAALEATGAAGDTLRAAARFMASRQH